MNMIEQFQRLDDLIVEHTEPPVRTRLRNQLALTREQVEAYQASSDKQDQTLAAQVEAISELQKRSAELEKQLAEMKARDKRQLDYCFRQLEQKQAEMRRRHSLDYRA